MTEQSNVVLDTTVDLTYLSVRGAMESHSNGCTLWMENFHMGEPIRMDRGSFEAMCIMYEHVTVRHPCNHYWIEMSDGTKFPGDYGVQPAGYSFYQAVRDGNEKVININDWIERWHTANPKLPQGLPDYLGFPRDLYAAFLKSEDAIMGLAPEIKTKETQ